MKLETLKGFVRIIPTMFFVPFILFGILAVGYGVVTLWQGVRCESWPHTDGTILTAAAVSHEDAEGSRSWGANISYQYRVEKITYTSSRVAFGMLQSSHSRAQDFVNRYPAGGKVTVYYEPSHPDQAVLESGIHGGTWVSLVVGTLFLGFPMGALYMRRKATKTEAVGFFGGTSVLASQTPISNIARLAGTLHHGIYPFILARTITDKR